MQILFACTAQIPFVISYSTHTTHHKHEKRSFGPSLKQWPVVWKSCLLISNTLYVCLVADELLHCLPMLFSRTLELIVYRTERWKHKLAAERTHTQRTHCYRRQARTQRLWLKVMAKRSQTWNVQNISEFSWCYLLAQSTSIITIVVSICILLFWVHIRNFGFWVTGGYDLFSSDSSEESENNNKQNDCSALKWKINIYAFHLILNLQIPAVSSFSGGSDDILFFLLWLSSLWISINSNYFV